MPSFINTAQIHSDGCNEFRQVLMRLGYREAATLDALAPGRFCTLGWTRFARTADKSSNPVPADFALMAIGSDPHMPPTYVKVHATGGCREVHTSSWRSVALAAELSGRHSNLVQVFIGPHQLRLASKFEVLNELLSNQYRKTGSAQVVCRLDQFVTGESSALLARGIHLQA